MYVICSDIIFHFFRYSVRGDGRQKPRAYAITLEYGITGFILVAASAPAIELFAAEVAPATRELVAAERAQR
jgi:hypothetical protein